MVKKLRLKIEGIYKELIDSGADAATIKRKLGPFSRDMAMISDMIDSAETPVAGEAIKAYDTTRDVFSSLLNKNG